MQEGSVAMLEFRLLGPVEVVFDGEPVALGGQRRRAVLAMLVLQRGRVVSTDRLIAGVWGESPPETVLTALHGHVSQLRRVLGDVIVTRAPGYLLEAPDAIVDVEVVEARLEQGRASLAAGDPVAAARALDEASRLWRGPPLDDLVDLSFARDARPALEELEAVVREERAEADLAAGRTEEVVPELRALVALNPLRERPRAQLMLALHRAGRQAEALAAYDDARRALSDELGIEPGEPLRELHAAILRDDPALGRPAAGPRPIPAEPRATAVPPERRRTRHLAVAAGAAVAAVAAIALAQRGGEDGRAPPALRGAGIMRVDPDNLGVEAAIPLDGIPTTVTAAGERAWAIDADGQTVSELTGDRRVRTFATGATPTDLAAGASGLWIAQGRPGESAGPATRTTSVAHVSPRAAGVAATVPLPGGAGVASSSGPSRRLALTREAVWAIAQDGRVLRIDPVARRVVRELDVRAEALAADGERLWILGRDRSLVPVEEATGRLGTPVDAPAGQGASIAVGGGAVWLVDPAQGVVTRLVPGAPGEPRTARIGAGAGPVAFGHGSAWVLDGPRARVVRLDGGTAAVTGEVRTGATPRDLAVGGDAIWITASSRTSAAAAGCSPVESGGRRPDAVIVVDLPLHGAPKRPTDAMAAAVGFVLRRHRHRAGRLQVGYRVCDVSTAQLGEEDLEKCAANARAYARDARVVIEVGPYTSSCARRQQPIAASAPGGPLAMVSPTNTLPSLTLDAPTRGRRFYARIIARDDHQAAIMAAELHRRDVRRVYVLDDSTTSGTYGLDFASYFAAAARQAGLEIVGRASWAGRDPAAVARRAARERPDAVYLSGVDARQAGRVIAALRRAIPGATIAGPDLLTPVARIFEGARSAARGLLLSTSTLPVAALPERGRRLAAELARDQRGGAVHPYAVYAAQAAEVAIDAIARSDGSRASVARALLATRLQAGAVGPVAFDARGDLASPPVALLRLVRGGGSRVVFSTEGAELVAVRRRGR